MEKNEVWEIGEGDDVEEEEVEEAEADEEWEWEWAWAWAWAREEREELVASHTCANPCCVEWLKNNNKQ